MYLSIRSLNESFTINWFNTIDQFAIYPVDHFFSNSLTLRYSNLNKAVSFENAPFFVTFRKLELIASMAFVVYMILLTSPSDISTSYRPLICSLICFVEKKTCVNVALLLIRKIVYEFSFLSVFNDLHVCFYIFLKQNE